MNRAEKFKEQNDKIWADTMEYIEELLLRIKDHDLSDEDIIAYAILEDFGAGYVGVFEVTRVDKEGVLYGTLYDEETDIPFDMMTNESLIQLAEKLEAYVDIHG